MIMRIPKGYKKCPKCGGTGEYEDDEVTDFCPRCKGECYVKDAKTKKLRKT